MPGKLFLLPNVLEESLPWEPFLPISVKETVQSLHGLIAESEKSARRYLRKFLSHDEMVKMPLLLLNEHTEEIAPLLSKMEEGETWGQISDAGLPCIADPGSDLVWLARQKGIEVKALTGPSSIILALQLSGFSGQQFAFHGYLPREAALLETEIKRIEMLFGTQIWIEAPYRSAKLLETLKRILQPATKLCVAVQLTTPNERVLSTNIARWRSVEWKIEKEPAIFLLTRASLV